MIDVIVFVTIIATYAVGGVVTTVIGARRWPRMYYETYGDQGPDWFIVVMTMCGWWLCLPTWGARWCLERLLNRHAPGPRELERRRAEDDRRRRELERERRELENERAAWELEFRQAQEAALAEIEAVAADARKDYEIGQMLAEPRGPDV